MEKTHAPLSAISIAMCRYWIAARVAPRQPSRNVASGDVLLAWENEAYLALQELGDDSFDIVVPSVSMLAEPPVALVETAITDDAQRALATAYLEHLYSPEAQALAFKHFYRAWDASAADPADVARFPKLDLVSIDAFGGWAKVQADHFGDKGIFDQIYVPQ